MKYLQDYIQDKQTELFNLTGTFFAFSKEQFNEGKKQNVEYVNMGGGMLTNKEYVETLINGLDKIQKEGMAQDLKENGKEKIILRELGNHEAWYDGDIARTFEVLEPYGITYDEIQRMFRNRKTKLN